MAHEKSDANQWFLRIAGGAVFGPVSAKGLLVWAEQGRVVPGNEVSPDRENWLPAEQLAELEMHWYVKAGTKTEGPFNRVAAESFLKSNKAPAGARLIHSQDVAAALPARRTPATTRTEPEPTVTPPAPPPERKASATIRHAVPPATDAKPAPDARDHHFAELPMSSEQTLEATTPAGQTAVSQGALEAERDELRRQLQELQAQLENVRANADKDALKRDRKLEALKQDLLRLQQEQEQARTVLELDSAHAHATVQTEMAELRAATAQQSRQIAELTEQTASLGRERNLLSEECQTLQQQLSSAMRAAADAANETSNGELRRRSEQLDAVVAGLRTELAQADQALSAERAALAELLAASNDRDIASRQRLQELEAALAAQAAHTPAAPDAAPDAKLVTELAAARARIAELQARLTRQPESPPVQTPDADCWLRQFATDELTTLDKALLAERQSFHDFREVSSARQEAIQARMQTVQQLLVGHATDPRRTSSGGKLRGTTLDATRLQLEMEDIRATQQRESKQFEEREQELLRRIRVLETEEARLRALMEATDMKGDQRIELMETIRRREQELAQERRHRDQDREQFQSAQQALLRRIEVLERGAGGAAPDAPEDQPSAPGHPGKPRRLASFGRWLQ
jgi:hypothetical protein